MSRYVPPHLRNRKQQDTGSSSTGSPDPQNRNHIQSSNPRSLRNLAAPQPRFGSNVKANPGRSNWSGQDVRFRGKDGGEERRDGAKDERGDKNEDESEKEKEKAKHADLESKETLMIQEFYSSNSKVYADWTKTRGEAHDNEHIARFFEKKKANSKC